MKKTFFFIIIFLLTLSCSLDRSNPLDIDNYPSKVLGIQVSRLENNKITITWNTQGHEDDDGYFIYRSMLYDGFYVLLEPPDGITPSSTGFYEDEYIGEWYYYKMSAYRIIDSKKLEGYRSIPKTWHNEPSEPR